MDEK
jgi:transcriptional regulator with GAF, ATPase, and Fis domain